MGGRIGEPSGLGVEGRWEARGSGSSSSGGGTKGGSNSCGNSSTSAS